MVTLTWHMSKQNDLSLRNTRTSTHIHSKWRMVALNYRVQHTQHKVLHPELSTNTLRCLVITQSWQQSEIDTWAISTFSPVGSLSSNGLRMRVCVCTCIALAQYGMNWYVDMPTYCILQVHSVNTHTHTHTHTFSYHLRTTNRRG